MFGTRSASGCRRAKRYSPWVVVAALALFFGHDQLTKALQRRESWQGTIRRVYTARPFYGLGRGRGTGQRWWEVSGTDGKLHNARISNKQHWQSALPGAYVVKRAGELDPEVTCRR